MVCKQPCTPEEFAQCLGSHRCSPDGRYWKRRVKPSLRQNGFEIVPHTLDERNRQELIACLGPVNGAGRRALLNTPAVAKLASSALLLNLVRPHLKSEPRP